MPNQNREVTTSVFPPEARIARTFDFPFFEPSPTRIPVKVKRVRPEAKLPEYAHRTDSGFDVFSAEPYPVEIAPGDVVKVCTGIALQAAANYDFQVYDKSGLAAEGISILGGVIDAGYTGELKVVVANVGREIYVIDPGQKVAQVRVLPRYFAEFTEVDELESRDRGNQGFGSTGLTEKAQ